MAAVYLEDLSYHRYRRASEVARLLLVSLFDYFPYRLLINLFRIQGILDFFAQRAGWGGAETPRLPRAAARRGAPRLTHGESHGLVRAAL